MEDSIEDSIGLHKGTWSAAPELIENDKYYLLKYFICTVNISYKSQINKEMIITLFIQLELYQFKTLFSKSMEEFGLENHFDGFKKIDEDLKKTLK